MKPIPLHSQYLLDVLDIDLSLLHRFNFSTQNCSLYPTTGQFIEAFDASAYIANIRNRKIGGIRRPLSIYVHIPFCSSQCFYCSQNRIVTTPDSSSDKYISFLLQEIKLQGALFQDDLKVEQIHFGGGTPTLPGDDQLRQILVQIQSCFNVSDDGEFSIEIDPRQVTNASIKALRTTGFNCVNILVQDFSTEVQQAIHRIQTEDGTLQTIQTAQDEGFDSIRIELLFGLPKQSLETFNHTLERIIAARPDRISLVNYVHFPEKFKSQRHINAEDLPSVRTRLELMQHAIQRLLAVGYVHIGINHFARHDDKLTLAQQQGRLYYNFQGYSTHADSDLIGLGVSAIGSIGPSYSQNCRELHQYYDKLTQNVLPIIRGLELTADDLLRRLVMRMLICNAMLPFESVETVFPIDFKHYFADELKELMAFEKLGLLILSDEEITITPKGKLLVCKICTVFDKHLQASKRRKHQATIL